MTRYYEHMQYTLYIRKGIDERFAAEEDKSKLVNTLLEGFYGTDTLPPVQLDTIRAEKLLKVVDKLPPRPRVDIPGVTRGFVPSAPDPETGYPCCTTSKPCKHWQWDGVKSAYVNELTGKEREVL